MDADAQVPAKDLGVKDFIGLVVWTSYQYLQSNFTKRHCHFSKTTICVQLDITEGHFVTDQ